MILADDAGQEAVRDPMADAKSNGEISEISQRSERRKKVDQIMRASKDKAT